jgi:hypothetical protein
MSGFERWTDEYPADLTAETTEWTERMQVLVRDLVGGNPGAMVTDLGAEFRITTPAVQRRYAFLGQTPSHGMQGANPDRIAYWKRREPVTFVAVQGDIGWMIVVRAETPVEWISRKTGAHRVGWKCQDMLKVAFTPMAFDRHERNKQPAVMWRWDLTHEYPARPVEGLF